MHSPVIIHYGSPHLQVSLEQCDRKLGELKCREVVSQVTITFIGTGWVENTDLVALPPCSDWAL